jgi:hypothetical protein
MMRQDRRAGRREPVIDVRTLAALDIVFHGRVFIVAEFVFGIGGCGAIAVSILRPGHLGLAQALLGCCFLGIALNYVPLLLHALSLARRGSARADAAEALADPARSRRLYTLQGALFIITPYVLFILAILQEGRKRAGPPRLGQRPPARHENTETAKFSL